MRKTLEQAVRVMLDEGPTRFDTRGVDMAVFTE